MNINKNFFFLQYMSKHEEDINTKKYIKNFFIIKK